MQFSPLVLFTIAQVAFGLIIEAEVELPKGWHRVEEASKPSNTKREELSVKEQAMYKRFFFGVPLPGCGGNRPSATPALAPCKQASEPVIAPPALVAPKLPSPPKGGFQWGWGWGQGAGSGKADCNGKPVTPGNTQVPPTVQPATTIAAPCTLAAPSPSNASSSSVAISSAQAPRSTESSSSATTTTSSPPVYQ